MATDANGNQKPADIVHPLQADEDVVRLRTLVREHAVSIGLSLIDQTKTVTAASELARNVLRYGGGGEMRLSVLTDGVRRGLRLSFVDRGPGIVDIGQAMQDGYTTGGGLGLGLGGSKRLVDDFAISTEPGQGTTVTITKWK